MKSHALRHHHQLMTRGGLLLVCRLSSLVILLSVIVCLVPPAAPTGGYVSGDELHAMLYASAELDKIGDPGSGPTFVRYYDDRPSVRTEPDAAGVFPEEFFEFFRPTRQVSSSSSSSSATSKRFVSPANASAAIGATRLSRSRKHTSSSSRNIILGKQMKKRARDCPCFVTGNVKTPWRTSAIKEMKFLRPRSPWVRSASLCPEAALDHYLKLAEDMPASESPFLCDSSYDRRGDVDGKSSYSNWFKSAPFRSNYGHLSKYLVNSVTDRYPVEPSFSTRRFLGKDEFDLSSSLYPSHTPDSWASHHAMGSGTRSWIRFDDPARTQYFVPNRGRKGPPWPQQQHQPYAGWKWMMQGSRPGSRNVAQGEQSPLRSYSFNDLTANAVERIEKKTHATTTTSPQPTTSTPRVTGEPFSPASGTPHFKHRALFRSATDGYSVYRIPTIIRSKKGTLLVFSEARKHSVVDHGQIDIVYRRSTDNGKTWEPSRVLINGRGHSVSNPAPVADLKTGAIVLLFCRSPSSTREVLIRFGKAPPRTVWMTRSLDDGYTWTYPTEITNSVREEDWSWYATGPVHGIQLKSGRLVVPCNHVVGANGAGGWTDRSHVVISDDSGKTWRIGGISRFGTNEATVTQVKNGSLYLNSRNMLSKKQRFSAWSHDNGITFRDGRFESDLIEPTGNGCQGSVLRVLDERGNPMLLFANPATVEKDRRNMTVVYSLDEGRTWKGSRTAYAGPSAYSDMAVTTDGLVTLVYERGKKEYYESIAIDQFNLAWLLERKSSNRKRSQQQRNSKRAK